MRRCSKKQSSWLKLILCTTKLWSAPARATSLRSENHPWAGDRDATPKRDWACSFAPPLSPIMIAEKKNKEASFCIDFRKLNLATEDVSFPMPTLHETVQKLDRSDMSAPRKTRHHGTGYSTAEAKHGIQLLSAFQKCFVGVHLAIPITSTPRNWISAMPSMATSTVEQRLAPGPSQSTANIVRVLAPKNTITKSWERWHQAGSQFTAWKRARSAASSNWPGQIGKNPLRDASLGSSSRLNEEGCLQTDGK